MHLRSVNVIYCEKRTLCKTLYIGETGEGLDEDRFREHPRDVVQRNDKLKMHPDQSFDTTCLTILTNTC